MANSNNFYDISKRLISEKPTLKIDDEHIYTINNDKNVFLKMQEIQRKNNNKNDKNDEDENSDQELLKLTLGEENAKEVDELLQETPNYIANFQTVMISIMAGVQNVSYEDMEKRFQRQSAKQ